MIKKILGLLVVAVIILIILYNAQSLSLSNLPISLNMTPVYFLVFILVILFIFYRLGRRR
jgi:hypothetical protein